MSVLLKSGMIAPMVKPLKWTCEKQGWWCALFATGEYRIGGPLGRDWYLYMPDDTVEIFYTKRDAIAHAQEHFEKYFKVIARGPR